MNNDSGSGNQNTSHRKNKWLQIVKKIVAGAIIAACINFILLLTGWHSWATFSKGADNVADSVVKETLRLSPVGLVKSIASSGQSYTLEDNPEYAGSRSLKDKLFNWLGFYWNNKNGNPFWFGRVLLITVMLAGFGAAREDFITSKGKLSAVLFFPVNVIIKFLMFLLGLSIIMLILYVVTKLLLAIAGGIVAIYSSTAVGAIIIKFIIDEAKNEAAGSAKKTVAASLFPFWFKRQKPG